MKKRGYYSPEVRERVVRLVFTQEAEHASQWAAISSIAEKVGCTAETLGKWVRRAERDSGSRPGLRTDDRERLKDLEREVRELGGHMIPNGFANAGAGELIVDWQTV